MTVSDFEPPVGWRTAAGDMARRVAATDWSATPVGAREGWSPSLRLAVEIILASAFPMALRWGPDFVLIYNDGYRPILGDKHPWALGRPAREAWAEVWPQIEPLHIAILEGEAPSIFADDMLLRINRRGSQWEDARFTLAYSPIADPTAPSGVGGIFVTAVEITERRAMEAQLAESRSYLSDLLRSSGEAFYAVDREGRTTLCNQAFLRLLGFAREEDAVGRKLHPVIHHTHPDGSAYDKADCPIYRCASSGEAAHVENETFYRLDGAPFPVEYWVSPIWRDGAPEGAICTFIDISERRAAQAELARSEAQFRAFSQAMPNHVWASPPDGQLDWFNDRVYEYSGAGAGELDGTGWAQIVHPQDRPAAAERWGAALASGDIYQTEFRLRRADGVYRWHLARAVPIRNAVGDIERWIGTNTDIEDQKSATQALAELNVTLENEVARRSAELMAAEEALRQSQKMEAVGQLTGGIAHDFNNMLSVVMGSLELLKLRLAGSDERALRYLDAAEEGGRRAALLTQRLLAFSRQQPLEPATLDANTLVAGMSDLLRHSIGADIRLETVLADGLWRTRADPNQLENVVLNLAVNARDAMPEGGRLTIETRNAQLDDRQAASLLGLEAGQYVLITVSDTGTGMAPEVIDKAFDPFFTTKAVGKGTGLGLSQVYGFVKQSGGHVRICSESRGRGTSLEIYLPRHHGAREESQAPQVAHDLALGDENDVVLLVEDEPAVRRISADALRELGYQVVEADGAAAALRLLDAHPQIVLLLTDIVMPEVDGARLAEEARRRRPDLKVLFSTGFPRNTVVHGGVLDAGVELIGKPFTLAALAAKLRGVLEARPRGSTGDTA